MSTIEESRGEKSPRKPMRSGDQPSKRRKDVRAREAQVMEMIRAGVPVTDIAEQLDYADHSAIVRIRDRVIRRHTNASVLAWQAINVDRLEALIQTFWPKARRGDVQAAEQVRRLIADERKVLGLDHADGIAERQVELEEAKVMTLVGLLNTALSNSGINETAANKVRLALAAEVRSVLPPAEEVN